MYSLTICLHLNAKNFICMGQMVHQYSFKVKNKNLPFKSKHLPLNEIASSWGSLNRHFLIVKTFIESCNIVWGTSPTIISQSWIFIIIFLKVGEITCDMPKVMEICYEVICNIHLNASRSPL